MGSNRCPSATNSFIMRTYCVLVILALLGLGEVQGQTTFNIRDRYGFLACVLTSIVPTDSCYYATGIIADTLFPYRAGAVFIKFDLNGEPVLVKTIKDSGRTYEPWFNSLQVVEDGSFYNIGVTVDSVYKTFLIKYDSDGDSVFVKKYLNPYYPNASFIQPRGGAKILPDKSIVSLNWIGTTDEQFGGDTNYYLIRTDSLGNMIWGKTFATNKWERPASIGLSSDGKIIGGGIRTNETTNVQNYVYQCHLFQFDTAGNYEWEWTSPVASGLRDAANDLLVLDDGSIIVASGIGHEQQHSSVNEVYFDRYVFKLNPQHEIEWELTFPDAELNYLSKTTNLVELSNGEGYVVAGVEYQVETQPPWTQPARGWITKISTEGDSVWTRRYSYLSNVAMRQDVYDMKETPDGGLILCGEAFVGSDTATYPQRAWLLKLDRHGCLVPGCHLSDAVEEGQPPQARLSIYPNPAHDFLNFYARSPGSAGGAVFRIVDAAGQLVETLETDSLAPTFVLPLQGWPPGAYWLQLLQDGRVLDAQPFVIAR